MKLSFLSFALAIPQAESALKLRAKAVATSDGMEPSNPIDVLGSQHCNVAVTWLEIKLAELLDSHTDDELISLACNKKELDSTSEEIEVEEEDIATEANPCKKAFEEVVESEDSSGGLSDTLDSFDTCAAGLEDWLAELRGSRVDSGKFALAKTGQDDVDWVFWGKKSLQAVIAVSTYLHAELEKISPSTFMEV